MKSLKPSSSTVLAGSAFAAFAGALAIFVASLPPSPEKVARQNIQAVKDRRAALAQVFATLSPEVSNSPNGKQIIERAEDFGQAEHCLEQGKKWTALWDDGLGSVSLKSTAAHPADLLSDIESASRLATQLEQAARDNNFTEISRIESILKRIEQEYKGGNCYEMTQWDRYLDSLPDNPKTESSAAK